jgi:hypothetical protein
MKPKTPSRMKQGHLLYQDLLEQLDPKDPLLMLAKKMVHPVRAYFAS